MKSAIRILAGAAEAGNAYVIGDGEYAIGRNPGGWVQLVSPTVSRLQCVISFSTEEGRHVLQDRSDTNATLINGVELRGPTVLDDGDLITLGAVELEYLKSAPDEARTSGHLIDVRQRHFPTRKLPSD